MKIKGVKVLSWDPFVTFNVAMLIHFLVHIECTFGTTILFLYSLRSCPKFIIYFIYETFNDNSAAASRLHPFVICKAGCDPQSVQSVLITINAMSLNPAHVKVYSIQLDMIHSSATCDRTMAFSEYSGFFKQ